MTAICIARFDLDRDLIPLISALSAVAIVHRVIEEQGAQLLWLHSDTQREQASQLVQAFEQNTLASFMAVQSASTSSLVTPSNADYAHPPKTDVSKTDVSKAELAKANAPRGIKGLMILAPVTWILIAFGIVGYAVIALPLNNWLSQLTYTPIKIIGEHFLQAPFAPQEFWRLLTPIFIHFSFTHILFNAGAMLQVGSWIERLWGWKVYLTVCLISGIAGNILQYAWFDSVLFGGLSGVVFGLFTFNGVTQWLNPRKAYALPIGAYAWLAVWLVAGFTPLMESLLGIQMGNGAHLGGALAGLLLAVIFNFRGRYGHSKS